MKITTSATRWQQRDLIEEFVEEVSTQIATYNGHDDDGDLFAFLFLIEVSQRFGGPLCVVLSRGCLRVLLVGVGGC